VDQANCVVDEDRAKAELALEKVSNPDASSLAENFKQECIENYSKLRNLFEQIWIAKPYASPALPTQSKSTARSSASAQEALDVRNALLHNGSVAALFEQAVRRGEGQVTSTGAFAAVTGPHTGRSPADKFIVRDPETEAAVWWDNSKALTPEQFDTLHRE